MSGWVKDYRSLWNHPLFKKEPMTEREAWRWLCSFARHDDGVTRFKASMINLSRGQLIASRGRLSREWMWTERRVRTFLQLLESQEMIAVETDQGVTKLTVCNYDLFQGERPADDRQLTSKRPASDQQVTTNKNEKNGKNGEELTLVPPPDGEVTSAPEREYPDWFEEFWKSYPGPRKKLKAKCFQLAKQALKAKTATTDQFARAVAERRCIEGDPSYQMAPERWLRNKGWLDEPSTANGRAKLTAEQLKSMTQAEVIRHMRPN